MDKDTIIETILVILVFGTLLYIGPGSVMRHSLSNSYPVEYAATDGFMYEMLATWVYDHGSYYYNPPYAVEQYNDSIAYHPFVFMQLGAVLAHTSGMQPYDAVSFLWGMCILFLAFTIYVMTRAYNRHVAIASLPLYLFLFIGNYSVAYTWGESLVIVGSFFLAGVFLLIAKFESRPLPLDWLALGILIGAIVNTHVPEAIFLYAFLALFIVAELIMGKTPKAEIKRQLITIGYATIVALILSVHYLIIFFNGYYQISAGTYQLFHAVAPQDFGAIRVATFPEFTIPAIILILAGAALAILLWLKKHQSALLVGVFMLAVGFSNYIGLSYRAFQTRYFWPAYLAILFGLAIMMALRPILKGIKPGLLERHGTLIVSAISVLIGTAILITLYHPVMSGAIYPEQYDAFSWIDHNTPQNAKVLLLYGDGYSQSGRILKRSSYQLNPNDYGLLNQSRRTYGVEPLTMEEMYYIYRTGLFTFGYHAKDANLQTGFRQLDICGFDYYVIDGASAYASQLAQMNQQLHQLFLHNNMTEVHQNRLTSVLYNPHPGGDCLAP